MYTETPNHFITFDDNDNPYIQGTTIKVLDIIISKLVYGSDIRELQFQYPQLNENQIESAIEYFEEHKETLNQKIQQMKDFIQETQKAMKIDPFVKEFRSRMN